MFENQVGKRYAEALSNSIQDTSQLNPALESLQSFCRALEDQEQLTRFFAHPSIPGEKKDAMVKELCDRLQVGTGVRNMLLMLSDRRKILFLKNITEYFEKVVDDRLGQVRVGVNSAHELSQTNIERLVSALSEILGKTVLIDARVDESLLGGIQLQVGDQVADATIKNRLAMLKRAIEKEEVA